MKKSKNIFKQGVLCLSLCCTMSLFAEQVVVEVPAITELEARLAEQYSATEISEISDLKVITPAAVFIGPDDIAFLNQMPKLVNLDLSDASVTTANNRTDYSFPRNSFDGNKTIKSIVFPKNLTGLNRAAFSNTALEGTITIPKGVKNVAEYDMIFGGSYGITAFEVEDGNSFLKAEDGILYTLDGQTLLVYPYGKEGTDFTVPEGVTTLGTSAFGWNDQLETITIASTVVSLPRQDKIINGSTKIKAIYVEDGNPKYGSTNGFLVDLETGTLMAFPPANTDETIVIDGSIVKNVPNNYFSYAVANLKNIIFTEGVETIGAYAFKIGTGVTSVLEYIELPASLKNIEAEAFVGNKLLKQVICKAEVPPVLNPKQIFRESNTKDMRCGVPANAVEAYKASTWNINVSAEANAVPEDQIVPYYTITVESGTCIQSASVAGYNVAVKANDAPEGMAFVGWDSQPEATFISSQSISGLFVMPEADVTVTARYAPKLPYTIMDAVTQSGEAPVGGVVDIVAMPEKDGMMFHKWIVVKGEGVIIDNPYSLATTFTMVDDEVTIAAVYEQTYYINIVGGSSVLDAFPGDVVTIKALPKQNEEFVCWVTTTENVDFSDATEAETTFIMPSSDVDIMAVFQEKASALLEVTKDELFLYPNPAENYIRIANADALEYRIYNSTGTMVMSGITNGELITITHLPAGLYVISTSENSVKFVKKAL